MSTSLVENAIILTLDDPGNLYCPGYIWIEHDRIGAVGSGPAPDRLSRLADFRIDGNGMVAMPGMVNAHTHLFQTFLRGLADDKPLLTWLETAIWPVASELSEEEAYWAAQLGLIENIRGGATAVIDHQYIHTDLRNDDGVLRAAQETGIRFLLARGWTDVGYHPAFMEDPQLIFSEMERLHGCWHGVDGDRIRIEFGPLIPWGCSDDTMLKAHAQAREWGIGTMIHVAETQTEVAMNLTQRGMRHVEWLDHLHILGPDLQLVHSVWLDDNELDLIATHGAVVVHCPVANMYLASGIARVPEMLQRGIDVALATDGPGSNNNQDMLEVLKMTAMAAKVGTLDATALLPEDVLRMACIGGANAFGQRDRIGTIEIGKQADVVLIDLRTPFAAPVHHVASALVYSVNSGSVDTVMVAGRILMQGKQITCVDEAHVLSQAQRACERLFNRAGVVI